MALRIGGLAGIRDCALGSGVWREEPLQIWGVWRRSQILPFLGWVTLSTSWNICLQLEDRTTGRVTVLVSQRGDEVFL